MINEHKEALKTSGHAAPDNVHYIQMAAISILKELAVVFYKRYATKWATMHATVK